MPDGSACGFAPAQRQAPNRQVKGMTIGRSQHSLVPFRDFKAHGFGIIHGHLHPVNIGSIGSCVRAGAGEQEHDGQRRVYSPSPLTPNDFHVCTSRPAGMRAFGKPPRGIWADRPVSAAKRARPCDPVLQAAWPCLRRALLPGQECLPSCGAWWGRHCPDSARFHCRFLWRCVRPQGFP